jgi:hypothetical protein
MQQLGKAFSEHIVRLIFSLIAVIPVDKVASAEWNGVIRRLLMEYCCPQGSFGNLLEKRITQ